MPGMVWWCQGAPMGACPAPSPTAAICSIAQLSLPLLGPNTSYLLGGSNCYDTAIC
jgi:hypothetical protein